MISRKLFGIARRWTPAYRLESLVRLDLHQNDNPKAPDTELTLFSLEGEKLGDLLPADGDGLGWSCFKTLAFFSFLVLACSMRHRASLTATYCAESDSHAFLDHLVLFQTYYGTLLYRELGNNATGLC